jgi:4-diphosphocytidyl-2-C-methyl-D-erythritol kinase
MITVPSFAKINLYLSVLEREKTGYHLIETVFQTVALHDDLTFEKLRVGRLVVESDLAPSGEANIVYRAASLVLPPRRGIRIGVRKRIPIGAGLGGGSGNAAVTLLALNSIFRLGYSIDQLSAFGEKLGADVPFFLWGGTAAGTHYGEKLWPLPDAPACRLTLLYPGTSVSTVEAYGNLKLTKKPPLCTMQSFCYSLLNQGVDALDAAIGNDFEHLIYRKPGIADGRAFLRRAGFRRVHLSGSGSALFGLGRPSRRVAPETGCRVWNTRFLSRNQYRKELGRALSWPAS